MKKYIKPELTVYEMEHTQLLVGSTDDTIIDTESGIIGNPN